MFWPVSEIGIIGFRLNSAQFQRKLPAGAELGNKRCINSVSIDAIHLSEIFSGYYFALKSAKRKVRYCNTKTAKLK